MFQPHDLAWLLLDTFLKSSVLLLGCWVAVLLLRKLIWHGQQAHNEHRLWLFLLVSMYALPIIAITAPGLRIPLAILPSTPLQPKEVDPLAGNPIAMNPIEQRSVSPPVEAPNDLGPALSLTGSASELEPSNSDLASLIPASPPRLDQNLELGSSLPTSSPPRAPEVPPTAERSTTLLGQVLHGFQAVWLVGVLVLLGRFLVSSSRVHQLLRSSRVARGIRERTSGIPTATRVLENDAIQSPVVIGWMHHRIILPSCWRSWSVDKLSSVVNHEVSHIRRGDGLVSLAAEINSIVQWTNPAAWIVRLKLARLAEFACDQAAIGSNGSRLQYAKHLLEIASLNRESASRPGIAMAASSEVGERIERILDFAKPLATKTSKWFLFALLVLGTPVLALTAAIRPIEQTQETEAATENESFPSMKGHQWYREEGERRFLRFRLSVLNQDGTLATDAIVRARSTDEFEIANRGDYFEFEHEIKPGFAPGIRVLAKSQDGSRIGILTGGYDSMTRDAKNGLRVTLEPASEIKVRVVDEGEHIPNASVGVDWTGGFETFAVSDSNGVATFKLAPGTKLSKIGVTTSDGHVGGYQFNRKPVRDPLAKSHEVELHPCKGRTIRVFDGQGRPVPNLKFELHMADKENFNFIPLFGKKHHTTNEQGEAFCEWFPDWKLMHAYLQYVDAEQWSKIQEDTFEDGVLVSRLEKNPKLQRVTVSGKVNMPAGMEHSFLVKLGSFEHPEEGRYDSVQVRTDKRGYFTADVMPGATYCAFIVDADWVSDYWASIPFDSVSKEIKPIELNLIEGEPVEIVATYGPARKPLANLQLSLRQGHHFEWYEDDERQSGSLGRQWWVTTDEDGKAQTFANLGEISAWPSTTDWRPEIESIVEKGKATRLEFHRESPGKRLVAGSVVSPSQSAVSVEGLSVRLLPMDGESRDEAIVTTDASGNFQAEISAAVLGAVVRSVDGSWFAAKIFDAPDAGMQLQLESTAEYRGTYLDSQGNPAAGRWVRIEPNFRNDKLTKNSPFAYSGDRLAAIESRTDKNGEFILKGVPYDLPLLFSCQELDSEPEPGEVQSELDRGRSLGTRFLTRGENRPPEVIRDRPTEAAPPKVESLARYLDDKLIDCRLMGARLLVIFQGSGEESSSFIRRKLFDTEAIPSLMSYLPPMWINGPESVKNPERKALFEKRDWPIPGENEILLCVLDDSGTELDRLQLDATEQDAAHLAREFLRENAVRKKDALKKFQYSLTLAQKAGKKVWIRISQTRCGPCYHFGRWIERNREELEQGFVFLKVDNVIDENGSELVKQMLGEKNFGIPYHQIYSGDGTLVIDSEGPLGNIGHPSSFEGISHLKKMLATHEGFSSEQVNRLANDARNVQ